MQVYNNTIVNPFNVRDKLQNQTNNQTNTPTHFQDVLNHQISNEPQIKFSKHASTRLSNRSINLTGEQIQRVEEGVKMATAKGINDSLVLVDDVALVINIKSKTVITAMHQAGTNENIFTNIDGAVIV